MSDERTPARVAAEQQDLRAREVVREALSHGIGLFQKFDLLTPATPVPSELHEQLVDVVQRLRDLNLEVAGLLTQAPTPPTPTHPSWPRLREELHRLVRSARWVWAHETQVQDRLTGGTWSHVDGLDLVEALRRVERLAVLFGYPLHPQQET